MTTIKSSFDHINNWEKYNLSISAYKKEGKGKLESAIKDLSLAIQNRKIDYDLFFDRGCLFFKTKKYKEAKEDLLVFINSKKKHNRYRDHIKALFLREFSKQKLNKLDVPILSPFYFLTTDSKNNAKKLIGIYQEFLYALEDSLNKNFEEALVHFKKINELDPNFMKHERYLLEHLSKEMRVILDLCLHIL